MVSLAHRASGVVLFLSLPWLIYLLDRSVSSPTGFAYVEQVLNSPVSKLAVLIIVWAFAHHFFAGIRFLLIDADVGVEKNSSRIGAWLVWLLELITVALFFYGYCL